MSRSVSKAGLYAKHNLDLEHLTFSIFTPDELRKLCTVRITTPLTFDSMGYPLPGGLYDKGLGPLHDKSDPCGTCLQNLLGCPGHFGYIELPLPVVNPLFHSIMTSIIKISCLKCDRLLLPGYLKELLVIQINLLDLSMITEAREIENIINEKISEDTDDLSDEVKKRVKKLAKITKSVGKNDDYRNFLSKTTESLRIKYLSGTFKMFKLNKKRCIYCNVMFEKVQSFKAKLLMAIKKEKEEKLDKKAKKDPTEKPIMKMLTPSELKTHLRQLWINDRDLLVELVPVLKRVEMTHPTDVFFFDILPVLPNNIRPVNMLNGKQIEHPQTQIYKAILQNTIFLKTVIHVMKNEGSGAAEPTDSSDETDAPAAPPVLGTESQRLYDSLQGGTGVEKLHNLWMALQNLADCLLDRDKGPLRQESLGLKQIIEKKHGIIRMNMMGKRVNFAARSVITPDPNLNIDEIGIPEEFAMNLTYPVPVTPWNVEELRKMVMNGPRVHPGATMVEFEDGKILRINTSKTQQESILKSLLTPAEGDDFTHNGIKIVHRHLCNGDILLLNRQPTLHKPSIMAHLARILRGEKTIRLHYANCKAYNADFDGDEMNVHFPQNELARSEGYTLANVCNQYLVPKDGTPLSGLIQDHMVSGVRLSVRGKFFTRTDYHQLVYQAVSNQKGPIKLLPPSILKPEVLWSGKQVLSTVIINVIPRKCAPINLRATAKISARAWVNGRPREWLAGGTPFQHPNEMSEAEVVIRGGELLCGVLDKTHYGATPYGLVHCVYELYGGSYATKLLNSLAKLFTCFLQQEGFTLGVEDILVLPEADAARSRIIQQSRKIGDSVAAAALDAPADIEPEQLRAMLQVAYANNAKFRTVIDRNYKQALDNFTNKINKACLPAGLLTKFPHNNLQAMVQSGAKGSTVNTMQISCLLGQIELEGKRPPFMISGRTLPSFAPFDTSPRAGGFIDGRFMTGIQPQEFFFHCMAGREGLIDTAVKTSRSGYLQRCIVKHLEGLRVCYDLTVRDSDRSVVQFLYGEDGMDISKAQFLKDKQMAFLAENSGAIIDQHVIDQLKDVEDYSRLRKHHKHLKKWLKQHGDPLKKTRQSAFTNFSKMVQHKMETSNPKEIDPKTGRSNLTKDIYSLWYKSAQEFRDSFQKNCVPCPNPLDSAFQPDHYYGAVNDRLAKMLNDFEDTGKGGENFSEMLRLKAMQSLVAPGESVGLLAAQSIGEPSTQMTLNTFHFAGRGEMNVTLGIPRLREVLMLASCNIRTPSMEVPFLNVPSLTKRAEQLRKSLTRVTVANLLEMVDVSIQLALVPTRQYVYTLRFKFLPETLYRAEYNVSPKQVLRHMSNRFFDSMFAAVRKFVKSSNVGTNLILEVEDNKTNKARESDEKEDEPDNDSSDEEPEDVEDAKSGSKFREKHDDQEPEGEELEKSDSEDEECEEETANKPEEEEFDVVKKYTHAQDFKYDKINHSWCEITFTMPVMYKNIDFTALLKDTADKSVVWETQDIKRAITYMKDDKVLTLRTDGINITELFKHNELLDLNKLYCNEIHQVAKTYGIEAARRVIVKEVQDVFKVYGITVDPRHLLLIADYMTFNGTFEPLSRKGMESSTSPLQQISFESSLTFLKQASIQGKQDPLSSPSSCLMVGKPCTSGTGSFKLLQKVPQSVY